MRGIHVKHVKLGQFMKEARESAGFTREIAAHMIGLSSPQYLYRMEVGTSTFPATKLRRACELYGIKLSEVFELAVDDYRASLKSFLKGAS